MARQHHVFTMPTAAAARKPELSDGKQRDQHSQADRTCIQVRGHEVGRGADDLDAAFCTQRSRHRRSASGAVCKLLAGRSSRAALSAHRSIIQRAGCTAWRGWVWRQALKQATCHMRCRGVWGPPWAWWQAPLKDGSPFMIRFSTPNLQVPRVLEYHRGRDGRGGRPRRMAARSGGC